MKFHNPAQFFAGAREKMVSPKLRHKKNLAISEKGATIVRTGSKTLRASAQFFLDDAYNYVIL
jgi:hypothetical protein